MVEAQNALRFFELEWLAGRRRPGRRARREHALARDRHYLESVRRFRPHIRTEAEEDMLAEREPAAIGAWHTLFDQVMSSLQIPFEGRDRTLDERSRSSATTAARPGSRAYEAVFAALEPHAPVLAHVYDTLVGDRLVMDRVRDYGGPREPRDLSNELPPAAVDAMLTAVEGAYPLAHRWWRRKARILGLDRLCWPTSTRRWARAGRSTGRGHRHGARRARPLRPAHRADGERALRRGPHGRRAPPGQARRGVLRLGGPGRAPVHPDELHRASSTTCMTLAHELGHGMKFELVGRAADRALAPRRRWRSPRSPSTFAEHIVFERLLGRRRDPQVRLALLADRVEGSFATIFRQTQMVRYEQRAYGLRAEGKALLPERLAEFWLETNRPYYGDAVEIPDGYRYGWTYIPHFIHTRFYTYAYVFAALASFALAAQQRRDPERFASSYVDFLSIGGSQAPADQLAALGVDVTRPDAWDAGFGELERLVSLAESTT